MNASHPPSIAAALTPLPVSSTSSRGITGVMSPKPMVSRRGGTPMKMSACCGRARARSMLLVLLQLDHDDLDGLVCVVEVRVHLPRGIRIEPVGFPAIPMVGLDRLSILVHGLEHPAFERDERAPGLAARGGRTLLPPHDPGAERERYERRHDDGTNR